MSAGSLVGVVGYAAVDSDFRTTMEGSIPGLSQVMELLLGEKEHTSTQTVSKKIPLSAMIAEPVVKYQLSAVKIEENIDRSLEIKEDIHAIQLASFEVEEDIDTEAATVVAAESAATTVAA